MGSQLVGCGHDASQTGLLEAKEFEVVGVVEGVKVAEPCAAGVVQSVVEMGGGG